jgi:excisionase family DNA binding protein
MAVDKVSVGKPEAVRSAQLMTPEQCAAFLQIEVSTLYVMKSQGRIPYRKVGHLLRFDYNEIVDWTKPKGKD